jgi:hypothetical protein
MFFTGGAGYIGSPCVVELLELALWLFLARSLSTLLMEKNALLSDCLCSVSTMCSADPPETASSTADLSASG